MDIRMKREVQIRIGIITLILYCLTIIIFFMKFYKKIEPIYGEANELVMSIKHDNLIFFLIIAFLVCF